MSVRSEWGESFSIAKEKSKEDDTMSMTGEMSKM